MAREVPTAWEARADGQAHLHRIAHADALEEGRQDDAPMMPVMTTAIAVMEVTPPSISATATAIGVVTDFGTRESVVLSLRPNPDG